ncbi:MAG: DUF480 domain-containing protein [Candidatus Kapaibacterium sp.]|nr:MAG: DUF480 domain-containing protein [Candidatus Kapabacteria bacterium]
MPINLTPEEARVCAVLIEKELTTPEYYPMTANALTNACNQKSNRDPVVQYTETEVMRAFDHLRKLEFARLVEESASRSNKCRHRFVEMLRLTPPQTAVLCELMLRGSQTLGELRTRAERMHKFTSLEEVETTLNDLASEAHFAAHTYGKPLVVRLPRQAGQKEVRYAHLLCGEPSITNTSNDEPLKVSAAASAAAHEKRITALETELAATKQELRALQEELTAFKQQF